MHHLQASATLTLPFHFADTQFDTLVPYENVYFVIDPFFYKLNVLIPTYATKPILSTPIYTVVDEKIRRKETN
jgi:hypothetical protein